jgi:molecular chaperone DnaK
VSRYILGIDLGTVNCCVAVVKDGQAVVLRDGSDNRIPSCLGIQRGKEVVGHAARRQAVTEPTQTISAVKRILGHPYDSPEVQTARSRAPYTIKPSPLGDVLLEVGGKALTPIQVSARILQRVKQVAEEALGSAVSRAVISVPAHFNDIQRKATKRAAEYAGLEVLRLLNEPTAAAFAYGYKKRGKLSLAVYDLGGGTFDITVMRARGDTLEVKATDGDSYLGGEDFDHAIQQWLATEFQAEFGHDLSGDQAAMLRLREAAEKAKIELSGAERAQIDLPFLTQLPSGTRPNFSRTLDAARLKACVQPLVQRTLDLCERCLRTAGIKRQDIDEVLLVGGQSRTKVVREAVQLFFGKEPRRDINPDEVVAIGAALYAYSLGSSELAVEAAGAAEESYDVAVKQTALAAKIMMDVQKKLDSVQHGDEGLRTRLASLLSGLGPPSPAPPALEAEPAPAEDDSPASLPGLEVSPSQAAPRGAASRAAESRGTAGRAASAPRRTPGDAAARKSSRTIPPAARASQIDLGTSQQLGALDIDDELQSMIGETSDEAARGRSALGSGLDAEAPPPAARSSLETTLGSRPSRPRPDPRRGEPARSEPARSQMQTRLAANEPALRETDLPSRNELPRALDAIQQRITGMTDIAQDVLDALADEVANEKESDVLADEAAALSRQLAETLAQGAQAARHAESQLKEAEHHATARRVELIDVTSHSLGIGSAGDVMSVIIAHNTSVPAGQERIFTTNQDGQTEVEIRVYQGRERNASANQLLGNFILTGIAPAPRMEPKIAVEFRIDVNGILSVTARDSASGAAQSVRIEDPLGLQHVDPAEAVQPAH